MDGRELGVLALCVAFGALVGALGERARTPERAPAPAHVDPIAGLGGGEHVTPVRRVVLRTSAAPAVLARPRAPDLERAEVWFGQIFGAPVPWDDPRAQEAARDRMVERLQALEPDGEVHVECDAQPCVGLLITAEQPRGFERRARELGARFGGWGQDARGPDGRRRYVRAVIDRVDDIASDDASAWGRTWKLYTPFADVPDPVDPSDPEAARPLDW